MGLPGRTWVVALSALVVLAGGCDSAATRPSGHADERTSSPTSSPTLAVIDVGQLPSGRPPRVDYLAEGRLRHRGRTVRTDFPDDASRVQLLGTVDGRAVVTALQGRVAGDRFWAVDASGRARRLGGTYQSYDYLPRLVASTGHLWIHYEDRTTPRTIWEVDARTGRELAAYDHDQVPHGLAPADQALVDAWVARRRAVPDTTAGTRDGSLRASTRSVNLGVGSFGDSVVVRRTVDRSLVARFTFPVGQDGGVERVVFEGRGHVLVLATVSYSRRRGPQQAIVRCSLDDGSCERATAIGGSMALGVVRPLFVLRHPG